MPKITAIMNVPISSIRLHQLIRHPERRPLRMLMLSIQLPPYTDSKRIFRHIGENSRQCKSSPYYAFPRGIACFLNIIMRFESFNIIFDSEMVLNLLFIRIFYKFIFLFKKSFLNFKKDPSFNAVLICSMSRI